MKKINHNHLKPNNYYTRLFIFFTIISLSLTFSLIGFTLENLDLFLLKFIVIFFLIMCIASFIEFFNHGDYMSPLEVFDIDNFFNNLLNDIKLEKTKYYINKYNYKTLKNFNTIFKSKKSFFLSSIKKQANTYELTFIDKNKFYKYFIFKFLIRDAISKMIIKKIKGKFKIISIN